MSERVQTVSKLPKVRSGSTREDGHRPLVCHAGVTSEEASAEGLYGRRAFSRVSSCPPLNTGQRPLTWIRSGPLFGTHGLTGCSTALTYADGAAERTVDTSSLQTSITTLGGRGS